ncbi:phosphoribosylglycinamide formyltransferase [bacterium]|nr:phosphoribosylglycinamide formyltransferase [bacterium]
MTIRIGVLISGRGSNLLSLCKAIEAQTLDVQIATVVSNVPDAPGLEHAYTRKIPAYTIEPDNFETRSAYETELVTLLRERGVEWVVLAGYMKIVGKQLLAAYPNRIINIHPSLLPAFKGRDAQQQAIDYGVKVSGCTVHFVNREMDGGAIIAQKTVAVLDTDSVQTLSERILAEEHRLLPETLQLISKGKIVLEGRTVKLIQ